MELRIPDWPSFSRTAVRRAGVALSMLGSLLLSLTATADKSGVRPNALSLPSGPGSVSGLGEQFQPDLATGASSYSLPLSLPQGTGGRVPKLALTYASGAAHGLAGVGFTLEVGSIQRQTQRGVPRYGEGDLFLFNGRELVPVGGNVYRLEREGDFLRFRRSATHWEADAPDGSVLRFGVSAEARVEGPGGTFLWGLEQQVDSFGNRIVYSYEAEQGQLLISKVEWNARVGAADNHVEFHYEPRPDPVTDFRGGFSRTTAKRLSSARVFGAGRQIRRYAFAYEPGSPSRLASVTLFGSDDVTSMPPLTFAWTPFLPQAATLRDVGGEVPFDFFDSNTELTDLDGDSLPDLVNTGPLGHRVAYNRGARWASPVAIPGAPEVRLQTNGVQLLDMDGNGLADLVAKLSPNVSDFYFFRNQGSGAWGPQTAFTNNPGFSFEDSTVRPLDVDGDGLTDVMQTTGAQYYYWRNHGDGTFSAPLTSPVLAEQPVQFSDSGVRLADFNGDGLVDIGKLMQGSLSWWPNQGHGSWGARRSLTGGPALGPEQARVQTADLNGDGLVDLFLASGTQVQIWIQGSGAFLPPFTMSGLPEANPATTVVRTADLNGNGSTDILWNTPSSQTPWKYLDLTGGIRPGLLTKIDNGVGRVTTIEYGSSGELYQRDLEAGTAWTLRLPVAIQVVRRMTVEDGTGWSQDILFTYRNGYFDPGRRQFFGFERASRIQEGGEGEERTENVVTFDVGLTDEVLRGSPVRSELRGEGGRLLRVERSGHAVRVYAEGTDGRRVAAALREWVEVDHFEGTDSPVTVRETFEYDAFGNMTEHAQWGVVRGGNGLGLGDERITTTEFVNDPDRWLLRRAIRQVLSDGQGRKLRESRTYYDGEPFVGLPLGVVGEHGVYSRVETWIEGDEYVSTERVQRDEFGNVVAERSPGGLLRTFALDATHTFVVGETVHFGSQRFSWSARREPGTGKVLFVDDVNGNRSSARYDPLGRLLAVFRPGDPEGSPGISYRHEPGAPYSLTWTDHRVDDSGKIESTVAVHDGLGRERRRGTVSAQGFILSGVAVLSKRGHPFRQYVPFSSPELLAEPPAGTPFTEFSRDSLDRALRTLHPDGSFTRTEYGPLFRVEFDEDDVQGERPRTVITDGLGRAREILERARDTEGVVQTLRVTLENDAADNITRVVDAEGHERTLKFDGAGRLRRAQSDDTGVREYKYDLDGNPVEVRSELGVVSSQFDAMARPTVRRLVGVDGVEQEVVRYFYDVAAPELPGGFAFGRLTRVEDAGGIEAYRYDARGRVEAELRRVGERTFVTHYSYDLADRVVSITQPNGVELVHRYNAAGQLSAIDQILLEIQYAPTGAVSRLALGNGVIEEVTFDARQRLQTHRIASGGSLHRDARYVYDGRSNLISTSDAIAPELSALYEFDGLSRLVAAEVGDRSFRYAWSHDGNLASKDGQAARYEPARPHALAGLGAESFEYGPHGMLTRWRDRTVRWTVGGRPDSVQTPTGEVKFTWAHDGRLLRKESPDGVVLYPSKYFEVDADGEWSFVYVGARRLAKFTGSSPLQTTAAAVAPLLLLAMVFGARKRTQRWAALPLIALTASCQCGAPAAGGLVFFHRDVLGSVIFTTNAQGDASARIPYAPFGEPLAATRERELFAGKEYDVASGLSFHGARALVVGLARWASPDLHSLESVSKHAMRPQGLNPYSYAVNNPVSYKDQTGLFEEPVHGALTYHLAIHAGFSPAEAAQIALATAGVDHDPKTVPTRPENINSRTTEAWHFDLSAHNRLQEQIDQGVPDLTAFGKILHTVEDVGFPDAPGPHVRGQPMYVPTFASLFGKTIVTGLTRVGHPFGFNEDGSFSWPLSHSADQAYRNPIANEKLFWKVFDALAAAAEKKHGTRPSVRDAHAAMRRIEQILKADSKEKVDAFMNSAPVPGAPSYSDVVRIQASWEEKDSSIE